MYYNITTPRIYILKSINRNVLLIMIYQYLVNVHHYSYESNFLNKLLFFKTIKYYFLAIAGKGMKYKPQEGENWMMYIMKLLSIIYLQ